MVSCTPDTGVYLGSEHVIPERLIIQSFWIIVCTPMRRQFTCNNPCDLPCKRNMEKHNELMKQRNRMKWGRVVNLSKDLHPCVFPLILSMYGTALISVETTNVAVRIANFQTFMSRQALLFVSNGRHSQRISFGRIRSDGGCGGLSAKRSLAAVVAVEVQISSWFLTRDVIWHMDGYG